MRHLMVRGVTSATALILATWGYVDLSVFLFEKLPVWVALVILAVLLLLVLSAVLLSPAFTMLRYFGARPFESERIYVNYERSTVVDGDMRATVDGSRDIVFLTEPRERDLWDAFSVSPEESLDSFIYNSPDAIEVLRCQRARNLLIVFWRPHNSIVRGTVYRHRTISRPPVQYNDRVLYSEFHCFGNVGRFSETLTLPFDPGEVVAFARPRWRRHRGEDDLVKYALTKARTLPMAQPVRRDDGLIHWRIDGPERGRSYVLLALSNEAHQEWVTRLKGDEPRPDGSPD